MSNSIDVTILIPCLNEEKTIESCVEEALEAIQQTGVKGEVLIADNGSTDHSSQIAERCGARVILEKRKGYGSALMAGIQAARGRYILMGDADGSYDFSQLIPFLNLLNQGYDLVMGCRFPKCGGKIMPGAMPWKHRWIGNPVLSFLGRLFFKAPVDDFHCGLRAFKRSSILDLNLKTPGMEFASEMVVKACLSGLRIGQTPITLRKDKRDRPPHLRSWRDGWRHLRFLLLYAPNWLFIYPGAGLTMASILGFILLWPGPLTLGEATLDLNTLLASSAGIIMGMQVMAMGLFAKAYAVSTGLLPHNQHIVFLLRSKTAEAGSILALLLVLGGGVVFGHSFLEWRSEGYGPLSVQVSLRYSILALTLLSLGIQSFVTGFMLKLLDIKTN